jgi:hypothetical protein
MSMVSLAGLALLWAVPTWAGDPPAAQANTPPPHEACRAALAAVKAQQAAVQQAIAQPDLAEFRKLQTAIGESLRSTRKGMEDALISGSWKDRPYKDEGFDLTWRVDALETLNFITLAFTSETYKYPTGKVPASVQDATRRLFEQVDALANRVDRLNERVAAARGDRPEAKVAKSGGRS